MTSEDAIVLSEMRGPESRQALAMVPSGGSTSPRQQSLYTEEGQGDEGPWEPVGTGLRQQGGNTHPTATGPEFLLRVKESLETRNHPRHNGVTM